MKISDIYLVELLLILFQFYAADAIKCFQCDSKNPDCAGLTSDNIESPFLKGCENGNGTSFCRKTKQTFFFADNLVRITRDCGWITHKPNENKCFKYDTQFKYDTTCQCYADGCNSAFTFLPSPVTLAAVVYILYRLF